MGTHLISVKMTDGNGAFCTYNVFKVTVLNTPPYFLTPPSFLDLEVQLNSAVTQTILAADIKDDEMDPIFLSVGFETQPGYYIWAPQSLYKENPKYVMVFKPTDYSLVGNHTIRV
jgi:hypothetical protein